MGKRLFIKTYGCQMNVYDSGRMADVLAPLGFVGCERADEADMVILNTCHIREKAAEKTFSDLGRLNALKREREAKGGRLVIAVAGCVAQAEGAEILARAPYVDLVVGPQAYHRLPELLARATRAGGGVLDTDFPPEAKFDHLPEPGVAGSAAFLSVQEGCDKFCSFCVVPYTRGAEYSRPVSAVVAEARHLVEKGVVEITLLGQNVNAYHGAAPPGSKVGGGKMGGSSWGLGRLIGALAAIAGLARIRYTTSHPADMDDELIHAHRDVAQLMPFLHLPVQSGSDRILERMNRRHRTSDYLAIVERLRRARPDLALSSDFIVGFPGESEEDFQATLDLVRQVGFAQAYSFKYSSRPGTPAAGLAEQIAEPVKEERLERLQEAIAEGQRAFNARWLGSRVAVLAERKGRHGGQLIGRSPHMQSVHFAAPADRLGRLVEVDITAAYANSLAGRLAVGAAREVPA